MRKGTIDRYLSKKFGHLLVIAIHSINAKHAFFSCKCDCGETVVRRSDGLHSNASCGCRSGLTLQERLDKRREYQKKYLAEYNKSRGRHLDWQYRFANTKASAKKRKIPFKLTFEEFYGIASAPCVYCSQTKATVSGSHIDRKDSGGCYEVSNCVSSCGKCNNQKSRSLSYEDFMFLKRNNLK